MMRSSASPCLQMSLSNASPKPPSIGVAIESAPAQKLRASAEN
jgi:hypothetical protein